MDIVKALRGVDHMSVEDCFLQSPLFEKAAARIEALEAENAALRAERDHWESLVSRADHMIFPFVPAAPVNN